MDDKFPRDVCLFGLPGAGKGTLAGRITEKYKVIHIVTGDIARRISKASLETGAYAPADEFRRAFYDEVRQQELDMPPGHALLLDGFPRTTDQIVSALEVLKAPLFVYLDQPPMECARRLLYRGRQDDTPEAITSRIDQHMETIPQLLEWLAGEVMRIWTNEEDVADRLANFANWQRKDA